MRGIAHAGPFAGVPPVGKTCQRRQALRLHADLAAAAGLPLLAGTVLTIQKIEAHVENSSAEDVHLQQSRMLLAEQMLSSMPVSNMLNVLLFHSQNPLQNCSIWYCKVQLPDLI